MFLWRRNLIFQIRKKSPFSKISGYVWTGPEFKWASCKKRNNLDELINIPTMAEERSMIQISGLGPNIRTSRQAQSGIRAKIHSWSTIHCVFKIHDLPQKSIIRVLLRPTPSIRLMSGFLKMVWMSTLAPWHFSQKIHRIFPSINHRQAVNTEPSHPPLWCLTGWLWSAKTAGHFWPRLTCRENRHFHWAKGHSLWPSPPPRG